LVGLKKIKTTVHGPFWFLWLFTNNTTWGRLPDADKNDVHSNSITRPKTERGMLTEMMLPIAWNARHPMNESAHLNSVGNLIPHRLTD